MERSALARFVRAHPFLNERRRAVRFWQEARPRDLRDVKRTRTILRARRQTMIAYKPLMSLWNLASTLEVPGALVECGTCNGGSAAVIGAAAPHRSLWLFDSWQGLPEPGTQDITHDGRRRPAGWNFGTEQAVEGVLTEVGARAHLIPGWFEDTIRKTKADIGPIAFLHIDCDYYEPVKLVLSELYPHMVSGGVLAIDDYQYWLGCREAVTEFFGDVESLPCFERVVGTIRFRKP